MIGILLLSHGPLSEGIAGSLMMITGKAENVSYLGLTPGTTSETFTEKIELEISKLDNGQGVLVITDILGGSPFNAACQLTRTHDIEVITGLNLPMVLCAIFERNGDTSLVDLAKLVVNEGQKSIKHFEFQSV